MKAWLKDNTDKVKHFAVCLLGSMFLGVGFGIGAGLAAEYKDKAWGGKWDWYDLLADALGTVVGGVVHCLLLLLLVK